MRRRRNRRQGLTAYIKIEDPPGTRIQRLFVGDKAVVLDQLYSAACLTVQAVPLKYGSHRRTLSQDALGAMLALLANTKEVNVELAGTVIAN